MTTSAERETRERLGNCLASLTMIKPADLVCSGSRHEPTFRAGLPYFKRTLNLFRYVSKQNLREVPSEYLKIVTDDAEMALAQFREIMAFRPEAVAQPDKVRSELISEVRDAYRPIYEDLSLIINTPSEQQEHLSSRGTRTMLTAGLVGLVLAAAMVGFCYALYAVTMGRVLGALQDAIPGF